MISLLLETSSERGCIALFCEMEVIYYKELPFDFRNSKYLFSEIAKAFKEIGITPNSLKLIISGVGPGSYTGMRVAATTAKGFSFSLKIPLIGVCSLNGFIPEEEGLFASLIDAKVGGVYMQVGSFFNSEVKILKAPKFYSVEDALPFLSQVKTIVAPNTKLLKPKLENLGVDCLILERSPDPKSLAASAFLKYAKGALSLDSALDLLYLRIPNYSTCKNL